MERNGGRNKKDTRAYHVWRSVSPIGTPQAELLDLPPLLRQFKSEYEFIFSQLYKFAKTTAPSFHEAFTAPNLLRKFLEAYLGFRKPSVRSWSKKLELLLDSPDQRREIQNSQTMPRTSKRLQIAATPGFCAQCTEVRQDGLGCA